MAFACNSSGVMTILAGKNDESVVKIISSEDHPICYEEVDGETVDPFKIDADTLEGKSVQDIVDLVPSPDISGSLENKVGIQSAWNPMSIDYYMKSDEWSVSYEKDGSVEYSTEVATQDGKWLIIVEYINGTNSYTLVVSILNLLTNKKTKCFDYTNSNLPSFTQFNSNNIAVNDHVITWAMSSGSSWYCLGFINIEDPDNIVAVGQCNAVSYSVTDTVPGWGNPYGGDTGLHRYVAYIPSTKCAVLTYSARTAKSSYEAFAVMYNLETNTLCKRTLDAPSNAAGSLYSYICLKDGYVLVKVGNNDAFNTYKITEASASSPTLVTNETWDDPIYIDSELNRYIFVNSSGIQKTTKTGDVIYDAHLDNFPNRCDAGISFINGKFYYIDTSIGTLVEVDVNTGKVTNTYPLIARNAASLANEAATSYLVTQVNGDEFVVAKNVSRIPTWERYKLRHLIEYQNV